MAPLLPFGSKSICRSFLGKAVFSSESLVETFSLNLSSIMYLSNTEIYHYIIPMPTQWSKLLYSNEYILCQLRVMKTHSPPIVKAAEINSMDTNCLAGYKSASHFTTAIAPMMSKLSKVDPTYWRNGRNRFSWLQSFISDCASVVFDWVQRVRGENSSASVEQARVVGGQTKVRIERRLEEWEDLSITPIELLELLFRGISIRWARAYWHEIFTRSEAWHWRWVRALSLLSTSSLKMSSSQVSNVVVS